MRATAAIAALTSTLLFGCGDDGSPIAGEDCISNIGEGELVITEIYGNSPGADEGNEWFEIYNATSRTLNVGGMLLVKTNDEGEARKEHVMRELVLDPGDYVVVGGILEEFRAKFEYIDYGYGPDLGTLGNTAGRLMLMCGNDQIDRVDYIDLAEAKSAQLSGLISPPNAIDNDDFGNFCLASQNAFFADELGTPGEANEICAPLTQDDCIDNGMQRAVNKAQAGDIEIAEIMANPDAVGDDVGEWLELRINASIDLNGIQLGRAEPDTEEEPGPGEIRQTLAAIECLPVTAGDYVVLVRSTDPGENGGVTDPSGGVGTPLLYPLDFSLTNSTDGVYVGLAGAVYDVFTYASSSTGTATQIDLEGDFCDATEVYGAGDEGTPGAANGECETVVIVPDGMCIDSDGTTIRAINNPTNVGDVLLVEWMPNPIGSDSDGEWIEIRAGNGLGPFDLNGLTIQAGSNAPLESDNCLEVTDGGGDPTGVFLVADTLDFDGGTTTPDHVRSLSINNTGTHTINLVKDATTFDSVTYDGPGSNDDIAYQVDSGGTQCTTIGGTPNTLNSDC